MIYRKIKFSLQKKTLFTTTTWLISAPNIYQSTFGIVLGGSLWSPVVNMVKKIYITR